MWLTFPGFGRNSGNRENQPTGLIGFFDFITKSGSQDPDYLPRHQQALQNRILHIQIFVVSVIDFQFIIFDKT